MLFIVDPDICFPGEALLFTIVKGSSELGICCTGHISHIGGPNKLVKQEHISLPSIPGPQSRLDLDKARVLSTNIGHDVPNLNLVINKGSSRVSRSCIHFLVHSFISICRVLSFRLDFNVRPYNTIQCSPSSSILGGELILDSFHCYRPVLVINHWLLCGLLETDFMPLLVVIAANQNQVDCICNRFPLDSLHVLQIINTKLQVSH
jgi:hypothetical protein